MGRKEVRVIRAAFEVTFLGYLAGITAFSRAFSHLHVTVYGVPLFVGELTLLTLTLLAAAIHLSGRQLFPKLGFVGWALLAILAAGSVFAVRGLMAGWGLSALRHSALVYYCWLFFLTLSYLERVGTSRRILGALLFGAIAGSLLASVSFFASPALVFGHGAAGHTGLFAWMAIFTLLASESLGVRLLPKPLAVVAILVCTCAIFFTGYRTLLLVVAASVAAVTLGGTGLKSPPARRLKASLLAWTALLAASILVPRAMLRSPDRFIPDYAPVPLGDALAAVDFRWTSAQYGWSLSAILASGMETDQDLVDPTRSISFRSKAWHEALIRIETSPWIGVGFGPEVLLHPASDCDTLPSPTSNCGSAHNTYLTLAMRVGLPLTLLLLGVLGALLVRSARAGRRTARDSADAFTTVTAATALLSFLVFGLTSLLFESPYLSSIVWVLAGIVAHQTGPRDVSERRA